MGKSIGNELTQELEQRLSGRSVERYADQVILIHTVDSDGWAHPAVLSYYEVAARDGRHICVATYKDSRTTENMRVARKVTLSIFDFKSIYYIKGVAFELRREMLAATHNSLTRVLVEQVLVDSANPEVEPGAFISSGIRCVNPHLNSERARYDAVLKELIG